MENHLTDTAKQNNKDCYEEGDTREEGQKSKGVYFCPPLYTQRYILALKFLSEYRIKSVIDLGCSECNFIRLLTSVSCLETIAMVDIDRDLLKSKQRMIVPELRHYINRRSKPLHVSLFVGNAEVPDSRLVGYEAVVMIELIEHLYPDVLRNVTHNVFHNLKPKLCIVTTPNSEFNVLFKNSDPNGFRHWDHKFEWNRQEFQQWCQGVCEEYGYTVEFTGVGFLSKQDTHHLGPCSQAAIFLQQHDEETSGKHMSTSHTEPYELIADSDFPYEKDVLTLEEKIDIEVNYSLRFFVASQRNDPAFESGETMAVEVSRIAKFPNVKSLCDENGVRASLNRSLHKLSDDGLYILVTDLASEEGREDEMSNEGSDTDTLDRIDECGDNAAYSNERREINNSPVQNGYLPVEDWDLECSQV
ncbi:unnamed protein product [Lymnaea stagnalis]|uniref:Small RNA 2'-O-methyltransferase n=1 Tax=Lymnaea stagnalis TaxID=6523 RepID=A0AAV2IFA1_LYMST